MKIYHLEAKHSLLPSLDKYIPAYMLKDYAIPLKAAKYDISVKEVIKKEK